MASPGSSGDFCLGNLGRPQSPALAGSGGSETFLPLSGWYVVVVLKKDFKFRTHGPKYFANILTKWGTRNWNFSLLPHA